jgi:hypothetical protein
MAKRSLKNRFLALSPAAHAGMHTRRVRKAFHARDPRAEQAVGDGCSPSERGRFRREHGFASIRA